MYSQNNEDEIILNFFKTKYPEKSGIGTMIEIGANDGKTFSNSLLFAENGWKCTLIEPSRKAFSLMKKFHLNKPNIILHNFGFGLFNGTQRFYESGAYRDGEDVALYSSFDKEGIEKWKKDVPFTEVEADFVTWVDFRSQNNDKYDFISIDCEGFDLTLLSQMDLNTLGCECLCIEWNSKIDVLEKIDIECAKYGMIMLVKNPENVIYVKKNDC